SSSFRAAPLTLALFPYTTLFRSPVPPLVRGAVTGNAKSVLVAVDHFANGGGFQWRPLVGDENIVGPSGSDRKPVTQGVECVIVRSEEHTSELQSRVDLVCRLLLE